MRKIHETVHVGVDIHSRLVMPPMVTEASVGGEISEKTLAYYKKMAANKQFDLFIIEHSYVSEDGKASLKQMSLADDEKIAGHRKLVAAIKSVRPDAAVFLQLNHAGIKTRADIIGTDPMGPSVRPWDKMCCAMSLEDMARVKADFVAAALRAKKAGYDGAELHVAHGYLLNQFLSPLTNFRDDDYGEDRVKYPLEVFRAMKEALGDFPLAVRIGGIETIEGGTTVDEGVRAAKAFDTAGAAFLDMTGGMTGYNRPGHKEAGWFQDLSRAVKKETTAPVLLTGGITTYDEAEKLLAEDAADLFGIGRAFLKDPNWETDKL
ncbi:NADH:flavin oxidoreductase [Aedoeadaptatus acetigenes]|uniref:NADH:flavin oxidoreductase n=1 Tax=Aedoeadaptatus acetigenes TaxID=2981723 RepID=A0ABV1J9S7_9FIRM|nr:NADH:flavin oxidoreductase [Aedoeadaptatus acetigenes]MCU6787341.1 NADH:flavin oxidoreductase [Aedoeadaptatus acetigenes]